MNDSELEERLRARLHERFDTPTPVDLQERMMRNWPPAEARAFHVGQLLFAAAVVVAIGAVAVSASWTIQNELPKSAGGTVTPTETAAESASPIQTFVPPLGEIPAISVDVWHRLDLVELVEGPLRVSSVVSWSGGYVALGQTPNFSRVDAIWLSRDGRRWVQLPKETFSPPGATSATPCGNGVVVVTSAAGGSTTARYSTDGVAWTSTAWPEIRAGDDVLAGSDAGAIAVVAGSPNRLLFSSDCSSWSDVDLPGSGVGNVAGVATHRGTFIAVGDGGTEERSPVAWLSTDGLSWTLSTVETRSDDGFRAVYAGNDGLVARGDGEFGKGSYWTSIDGRYWRLSPSNPVKDPEGGDPTLAIVSDGTRLLGYGSSGMGPEGGPLEYWISLDGVAWTQLEVSGPDFITQNWAARPLVVRDGVLFSVGQGDPTPAWFGKAGP